MTAFLLLVFSFTIFPNWPVFGALGIAAAFWVASLQDGYPSRFWEAFVACGALFGIGVVLVLG